MSARDLGVKYLVRYQHEEMTLRSTFTQALVKKLSSAGAAGARREAVWALSDVSFQLRTGEIAALIGPNGSGKTTLLKTLAGILAPDHGEVSTVGQVGCLLTFGVGFNAHLTGRENILFSGSMLGIKNEKLEACTHDIIELSELGDFIDAPVRSYSSGMRIRLGFAISIHIAPDVLLLDEMLSAGDAAFSAKSG
ncbi:ABC transporter ATP-binding protein, partial [Myxococcota bacterium]|nr:ABC transporter ATP-binding protein [Myxococcota bacterium]